VQRGHQFRHYLTGLPTDNIHEIPLPEDVNSD